MHPFRRILGLRSNLPSMLLTALVAMVLLAGCAPFAGPPGPITYIAGHGQPAIVCLGDSLTAGDAAPQSESYPAWLQRRLTAWGYNYRVVNAGSSGDRVAGGLARLRADVLSYRPAIAVVELGSNDPGHTSVRSWESGLDTIITHLQAAGVRVILGGLDQPGMSAIYKEVASSHRTPLVWFTDGLWGRPGLWGDAHHPSGAGYRVVMQNFWPAIFPYLHRG